MIVEQHKLEFPSRFGFGDVIQNFYRAYFDSIIHLQTLPGSNRMLAKVYAYAWRDNPDGSRTFNPNKRRLVAEGFVIEDENTGQLLRDGRWVDYHFNGEIKGISYYKLDQRQS